MPIFSSLPAVVESGLQFVRRLATVKPKEPKFSVGLDLGASAVKVVAVGPRRGNGSRAILAKSSAPLDDAGDEQAVAAIKDAVGQLGLPVRSVNFSVSGQSVIMRVVEMPSLAPHELAQALPFEAQRHLPFQLQDVVLDGSLLGPAQAGKVWVLLVACKRDLLERRVALIKQAGLEPSLIDVDALALANVFTAQTNGQKTVGTQALVNIGAQWTNLVVVKGKIPYLVRDIPWGSVKLIHEAAEQLGQQDEKAIAAQLEQEGPLPPELAEALKNKCDSLSTDLQLSFDFFENRFGTPPDRVVVAGGFSRCGPFLEALKSHLVQPLTCWPISDDLGPQFLVAYGLALRGRGA